MTPWTCIGFYVPARRRIERPHKPPPQATANSAKRRGGEDAKLTFVRRLGEKNDQLTVEQLVEYRQRLGKMTDWEIETEYNATHNAVRSVRHLPSPQLMQELVQCWRELRRRRKLQF